MDEEYFKEATIEPQTVAAGDSVEIRIRLVLGKAFSPDKSRMILDLPGYLGYSRPTRHHQEMSGFLEVFCSNPDVSWEIRIWDIEAEKFASPKEESHLGMARRMGVIDFQGNHTDPGDVVEIMWGYLCNGFGTGTRVTTLVLMKEFYNTVHVRYFKDGSRGLPDYGRSFAGYARPEPDSEIELCYRVLPREPERIRFIRRQNVGSLLILDRFSNVCDVDDPGRFIGEDMEWTVNSRGVFETCDPSAIITPRNLPLSATPPMSKAYGNFNIYFGDLHVHTSFSRDCIEREKQEMNPDRSFEFARTASCMDFMALTDHHSPRGSERHKIGAGNWDFSRECIEKHSRDGDFIGILGYEFRCSRGDTVVLFDDDIPYSRMDDDEIADIRNLWESYRTWDYITIPHFHSPGTLAEGTWYSCPDEGVETVLEVFSCHGSYERERVSERARADIKEFRKDRNTLYFLEQGYQYGFICSSDGHKGNPGYNGLAAVYAEELSRAAIFEAIRDRRVYGTTNARIKLLFTINGCLMGSILKNDPKKILIVETQGESTIKSVDVMRNGRLYRRLRPNQSSFGQEMHVVNDGPSNWYVRVVQTDNHVAYSSPIWFV